MGGLETTQPNLVHETPCVYGLHDRIYGSHRKSRRIFAFTWWLCKNITDVNLYLSGNDFPVEPGFQSGNEDISSHPSGAQSHPCGAGPGLANIKEINRLRGGDLQVAAQANVQIEAEIGQKDHFRMT